ncbi:MAG: HAMP domain-containing histidine kinase, partial [Actinobacteria bacterium]|nr:HAMP domain-containing histidine kinase [Actinomycetota bacterium]
VVDDGGRVVAASALQAEDRPLTDLAPASGRTAVVRTGKLALLDRDSPFVVVVSSFEVGGQEYRVVVAESVAAQRQSVATVLVLLLVGFPLLLALVAAASWFLVGRALRPVERIRAQVAEIGARGRLDQRVPVPAARDEIGRLAVTMNDMLASLDAARTAQRRFVADAGHELRSPVATISAVLDVAREDSGGATLAELTPVLEAEAARIGRLVDDLLLLARVDEHAVVLETGDVDLDDVVDGEVLRLRAAHPRLRVERVVVPQRVRGDRARLRQVVANLGDNAARHARGVVRLVVAPDPDGALVVVEDDGPGIPPAERERVFGRFVRLDASRGRTSGGSGLGLAIVRELVAAHGGTVTIGDTAAGGCRVEVRLPSRPPDPSPAEEDGGQPPSGSSR